MQTAILDSDRPKRPFWRSRWWMPAFSLFLGGLMFAAFAIGDDPGQGAASLAVMAAVAALFGFGSRRSETLGGLGGPGRDERWEMIDTRATVFAGLVVISIVIGGWLYEVADGQDGEPYTLIGAAGGLAYIAAVAWLRWRG